MRLPRLLTSSSLLGRAGASLALRFTGLALQFLTSVAVARILGVEGFGTYALAFTVATLLGWLLGLGLAPLAERELPRATAQDAWGQVRGYVETTGLIILTTSVIAALMLWGLEATGLWTTPLGWFPVAVAASAQAMIMAGSAISNGLQRLLTFQVLDLLLRQSLLLGFVATLVASGRSVGPATLFWASTLSMVAILPLVAVTLWRTLSAQMPRPVPLPERRPVSWLWAALPFMLDGFAFQVQANLGVLTLGFQGDEAGVGVLRAAARAVDLIVIIGAIAGQVLAPMLSRALAKHDVAGAQRLVADSARMVAGLGLTVALALALGAELYLALFGPGFVEGAAAMRLLLLAQVVMLLSGPASVVMLMMGRQRTVLLLSVVGLLINFGLNIVLVPLMRVEGAALGTLLSLLIARGLLLALVLRTGLLDPTPFGLARRLGWRPRH